MAPSDAQSITRLIRAVRRDRPSHEQPAPGEAAQVDAAFDRAAARPPAGLATRPLRRRRTAAPVSRPADWPSIPGLELMQVLASGGMGVVFRGRQASLDRDVAVKFLRDGHRADSEQRERFLQEARAVARL